MIPDEAIEAAAKVLYANVEVVQTPEYAADIARLALEAATPHMTQSTYDEGWNDGFKRGEESAALESKRDRKDDVLSRLYRAILAAQLKVTLDNELGRETTPVQLALAGMKLPPLRRRKP